MRGPSSTDAAVRCAPRSRPGQPRRSSRSSNGSGVPVCQYIQTDPVDAEAVTAFFKALAPAELDAFAQAMAVRRAADEAALKAQAQQVERLRYRATLAERQFDQVDPDNRLVAAELERRWEETLRDLRQADASLAAGQDAVHVV